MGKALSGEISCMPAGLIFLILHVVTLHGEMVQMKSQNRMVSFRNKITSDLSSTLDLIWSSEEVWENYVEYFMLANGKFRMQKYVRTVSYLVSRVATQLPRPHILHTWLVSQGSWVRYPVWQHTFVSPSAFSRRAVVSYWRKYVHEVLVNCLGGLSLPRKSVVRLTDRPDMTLDVYRGR